MVDVVDDGAAVARRIFAHVDLRVLVQLVAELIEPLVVFREQRFEVGGEAFVQPPVRPVAAGEQIAEPLVCQLVREKAVGIRIQRGALVEERRVGERCRADVLHAAEDEVGDERLRVTGVRVGDARHLAEEREHLRRAAERALQVVLASARPVVLHRDAVPLVLDLGEVSHDLAQQVGDVRDGLVPVIGLRAAPGVCRHALQLTVADADHRFRHRDDDLAGLLVVRVVDAGVPVPRVLVLALRPRLQRLIGVIRVRCGEVEAAAG